MTTKQKTLIRDFIKYFDGLQYTNDVNSPSHNTLIEDSLLTILNVIRKI